MSACTPSSSSFLSLDELVSFAEAYGLETPALEVECTYSLLKIQMQANPDISSLVHFGCFLLACLPAHKAVTELIQVALVTSTESERSFYDTN